MSKEVLVYVPYMFSDKAIVERCIKMVDINLDEWLPNYADFQNFNNYVQKDNKFYCVVTFIKR